MRGGGNSQSASIFPLLCQARVSKKLLYALLSKAGSSAKGKNWISLESSPLKIDLSAGVQLSYSGKASTEGGNCNVGVSVSSEMQGTWGLGRREVDATTVEARNLVSPGTSGTVSGSVPRVLFLATGEFAASDAMVASQNTVSATLNSSQT